MTVEQIREKLKALNKTQVEISYESKVGYQTIRNIVNDTAKFEIKQNTLKKVEAYLNSL